MTRDKLEERQAELRKALQVTLEQAERLRGALQDCDYWLKQIELVSEPQPPQETMHV